MNVNQNRFPILIYYFFKQKTAYEIYSRLLKDRIIFLGGPLDDKTANVIIAQLLYRSNEDNKKGIHLYINSPGGSITSGLAVYDTMQFLRCDVATYCIGQAASMGALLLAGGKTGKRFLRANNRSLLHQPLITGQLIGPATDIDIEAQEILRLRSRLYDILAKHTGQTNEKVEKDCDRNLWLSAEEAIEYGIADRILQKAPEIVHADRPEGKQQAEEGGGQE